VNGERRKETLPAAPDCLLGDGEACAVLLGGRLRIVQPRAGYRFSIDALLLAHFVRLREGAFVLELGTGSGVIAVLLARRR